MFRRIRPACSLILASSAAAAVFVRTEPPPLLHHVIADNVRKATCVESGDLDNDGDVDLVATARLDDLIWMFLSDGTAPPTFTAHVIADSHDGAQAVDLADVNADGLLDVVAVSRVDGKASWHANQGGDPPSFVEHVLTQDATLTQAIVVTDLDGDLDADIVVSAYGADLLMWFENDGQPVPTFSRHEISIQIDGPMKLVAADLDGDGDRDIAVAAMDSDEIIWLEQISADPITFSAHQVTKGLDGVRGLAAADLDADGDLDLVSASWGGDTVAWHESDGGKPPEFLTHVIAADVLEAWSVDISDFDSDGDSDIVATAREGDEVVLFLSDGEQPPTFDRCLLSDVPDEPRAARAVDIDDDGDLDVLVASGNDNTVAWMENTSASACTADWNGDGLVLTNDFTAYLNDYVAALNGGDPTFGDPDLAEPFGTINTSDFLAYLNAFAQGCP